jgi:hypothetical protein
MVPMINPEEKIQRYYDNLWSVGKKFNQKFLDGGFHFGYYEKGVMNYRKAILWDRGNISILSKKIS